MSLLRELQSSLLSEQGDIGYVLLKARFLTARLGNAALDDWARHELEGYPTGVEVPPYRRIPLAWRGDFTRPLRPGREDMALPDNVIEGIAGRHWLFREERRGVHALGKEDELETGTDAASAAALVQMLNRSDALDGWTCKATRASMDMEALKAIRPTVRRKLLDITIALDNRVPGVGEVTLSSEAGDFDFPQEEMRRLFDEVLRGRGATSLCP